VPDKLFDKEQGLGLASRIFDDVADRLDLHHLGQALSVLFGIPVLDEDSSNCRRAFRDFRARPSCHVPDPAARHPVKVESFRNRLVG